MIKKTTMKIPAQLRSSGVRGNSDGRISLSKDDMPSRNPGYRYKFVSANVTKRSSIGQRLSVKVRTRMVRGSKINSVRFPIKAAKMMTSRRPYLTFRQPSGGTRLIRQRSSENRSRIVPSGQIHPHHTLPKISVRRSVTNAKAAPAAENLSYRG